MSACPHCAARLETPVFCAACGLPLPVAEGVGPFEILGLAPNHAVDAGLLKRRMLRASRDVHPDFFATAPSDVRELAGRNSALLNAAFQTLSDDVERANWLVAYLGGPDEQHERTMPAEFLAEVLEWNERLEEARAITSGFDPRLAGLKSELSERRGRALASIAQLLTPLPERGAPSLTIVRRHLNAVRYVDRALSEIEALRLARAATR